MYSIKLSELLVDLKTNSYKGRHLKKRQLYLADSQNDAFAFSHTINCLLKDQGISSELYSSKLSTEVRAK